MRLAASLAMSTEVESDQGVVDQQQALAHGHADVIDELHRRRAGATFGTVDDDEIRSDAAFLHGLGDAKPFPRVTDGEFEAGGFAAGKFAQAGNEREQSKR